MRSFWQQIRTACADHRWLALAACCYALFVIAQCLIVGVPFHEYGQTLGVMLESSAWAFTFFLAMMLLFFAYAYIRAALETPWQGRKVHAYFLSVARLFDKKCAHYFDSRLFADGLVGFAVFQAMAFIEPQKSLIQYINPYSWDPAFALWDKLLHFGYHPYQLIVPVVEGLGVWASETLAFVYLIWFFVMFGTCFYVMFIDSSFYRHMRFLWAYLLSWFILGSFCAVLFSSVGPIYFHEFYPQQPDLYQPLIAYLEGAIAYGPGHSYATVRNLLLEWTRDGNILDFNGISAMPSMHVAIAWLLLLYWGTVSRWTMILAALFFVLILIGSVYLGFHYAIDGYFAMAVVSLIWWGSGRLVHRLHPHARDLIRSAKQG